MHDPIQQPPIYQQLIQQIAHALDEGRQQAAKQVNTILVQTYWQIGKHIVEFEQDGHARASYGKQLLTQLAQDLKAQYGKGFSRSNLQNMRLFYVKYPIC